jgi:hypothetical protein
VVCGRERQEGGLTPGELIDGRSSHIA